MRGWLFFGGLWIVMILLRQDFLFAHDARLLFGVLPMGLAWQVGYTLFATLVLWALVRVAWPGELDRLDE